MNHRAHEEHKGEYEPLSAETERLIHEVIGAAIAVHRRLGPGFIESIYQRAMVVELGIRGIPTEEQKQIEVTYRGVPLSAQRLDLVIGGAVIVEVKAVKKLRPIHDAQVLSYQKASGIRAALLINFNVTLLVNGLRRFVR